MKCSCGFVYKAVCEEETETPISEIMITEILDMPARWEQKFLSYFKPSCFRHFFYHTLSNDFRLTHIALEKVVVKLGICPAPLPEVDLYEYLLCHIAGGVYEP